MMVKAVLTTKTGVIEQRTFPTMNDLTDHLKKNYGLYAGIVAKVIDTMELRQGKDDAGRRIM